MEEATETETVQIPSKAAQKAKGFMMMMMTMMMMMILMMMIMIIMMMMVMMMRRSRIMLSVIKKDDDFVCKSIDCLENDKTWWFWILFDVYDVHFCSFLGTCLAQAPQLQTKCTDSKEL